MLTERCHGDKMKNKEGIQVQGVLERIIVDPNVCHGQPCVRGTRIMVYLILELLETGLTPERIMKEYYPQLTKQDIEACLHYAASLIRDGEYVPFVTAAQ
jgi:uncharacterized protein (DUF433 family)